MTQCGQRIGFLTFTMCSEPATATCLRCGKLLCAAHTHTSPSGPVCPDCAAIGLDEDEAYRRGIDSSYYRWRSSNYDTYTASDYDNFSPGGGEMGGGGAAGDWDLADDTGESDTSDTGGVFQDS